MKQKQISLIAMMGTLGLLLSGVSVSIFKNNKKPKEEEFNWGGLRAEPFENRYLSSNDIVSEPKFTDSFAYNFQYMGIGNPKTSDSVWDNYRGETDDGESSKPVTVAIIDSGIDIYHEDFLKPEAKGVLLDENNISSYSILDPNSCYIHDPSEGNYTSSVVTDVGILEAYDRDTYDATYNEYYSHGTATASCIGASINGMSGMGIAPKVNLLIIRMDFYFTSLDVAIRYAVNNGAKVINMSLGAYSESFTDGNGEQQTGSAGVATALTSAITYANNKDAIVVAAAGNEKTDHKSYPACNTGVVGVGALKEKSGTTAASFSNFNKSSDTAGGDNNVDVFAPGYVYTANVGKSQAPRPAGASAAIADSSMSVTQGTSFASPLTAGAIALYRAKYPEKNRTEVINKLESSCDDIGTANWDITFGYGRVNVTNFLNDGIPVTDVIIDPSTVSLEITDENPSPTAQLSVSFLPENADPSYKTGLWISNNDAVVTVDETSGLLTAVGAGTTKVGFLSEGGKEGYCDVTVTDSRTAPPEPEPPTGTLKSISITRGSFTDTGGYGWYTWNQDNISGQAYIYATEKNSMQFNSGKTACSLFNTVAVPGPITNIHLVTQTSKTAKKWKVLTNNTAYTTTTLTEGTQRGEEQEVPTEGVDFQIPNSYDTYFVITESDSGASYLSEVRIDYLSDETPTVSLDKTSLTVELGETEKIVATANGPVTWTSDNTAVASVDNDGTVHGVSVGDATITASNGEATATCEVHVVKTPKVSLDKANLTVELNDTGTITATTNGPLTWESSNPSVASISISGENNKVATISGLSVGTSTITARNESASATCLVTVKKTPTISLNKTQLSLVMGESETLIATANGDVTWSSNNTAVASVDNNGKVVAIVKGTATITAKNGGAIATCLVTVTANYKLDSIVINDGQLPETVPFKSEFNTTSVNVTANYTNNHASESKVATLSSLDTNSIGPHTLTASYTEDGVTQVATASIFVSNVGATRTEHTITGGSIKTTSSTTKYFSDYTMKSDNADSPITWTLQCDSTPSNLSYEGGNHKAVQIGKSKTSPNTINISTADLSNETITKVVVTAGKKGGATLSVKIGDAPFGNSVSLNSSKDNPLDTCTFEGNASGKITITYSGGKGNAYFGYVEVFKAGGTTYSWTGDDQANSFISYLKTFNSCSSDWNEKRTQIPTLINEYNAMIDDAKNSDLMTETFEDNGGYSTSAIQKLQMIVSQYNGSLKSGESALTLTGVPTSQMSPISKKIDDKYDPSLLIVISFSLFVLSSPIIIIYKRRKDKLSESK